MLRINPNIKLVKGFGRSLVYNALTSKVLFVPNSLADIIQGNNFRLKYLLNFYGVENKEIISSYLSFLNDNNILIKTDKNFIPISTEWVSPNKILSSIIEVESTNIKIVNKAIIQLSELGCKSLEFRVWGNLKFVTLVNLCKKVSESDIGSLNIFLSFNSKADFINLKKLVHQFLKISIIVCSGAPSNKNEYFFNGSSSILYSTKSNNLTTSCGVIGSHQFRYERFLESQNHNTCLNRKITIMLNGDIKNCPSMKDIYGNLFNDTLKEILLKQDFITKWYLNKDKISKCKDCEFRYFCYDCRAYTQNPDDIYSKPLKCGYDPYTNKWEDWSTNPLSKKGIEYYGMKELVTKPQ